MPAGELLHHGCGSKNSFSQFLEEASHDWCEQEGGGKPNAIVDLTQDQLKPAAKNSMRHKQGSFFFPTRPC